MTFTYDAVGNRLTMVDGTGTTTYTYDSLYRLAAVKDGAGQVVGYGYDAAGNRTRLAYPNGKAITYTYDTGNRLATVRDWNSGLYDYSYDAAHRHRPVDSHLHQQLDQRQQLPVVLRR